MKRHGTLRLRGTINTSIVRDYKPPAGWSAEEIPFIFNFQQCLAHQLMELDTWASQNADENAFLNSTFQEITNSHWLGKLSGKLDEEHRHFQLATYDDVLDVICREHKLLFGKETNEQPFS